MQCLDARIASFNAVTRPKRSAKVAFPLDADEFPHLTPRNLAEAGFYHQPGDDEDSYDTCRCFLCDLELGGWDNDDDPFVEHVKRDGDCAWKEIMCRIEVDRAQGGPGRLRTQFPTKDALPASASNSTLREKTFGDWWPHQKPTAKALAKAGFVYTPSTAASDVTTCPLCKYEVEAWEEGDDPWEVHNIKEPECPFFTATVEGKAPASKTRAKTGARRGRSTVTTTAREPLPDPEDSLELPDPEAEEEAATAPRRRGRPPKASTATEASTSTTAKAPRSGRRKTAATKAKEEAEAKAKEEATAVKYEPESEAETQEPAADPVQASEPEPEPEPKRATKPLPRKRTTRQTTATELEGAAEAEPAAKPPPKPRGRPKKTVAASAASEPASEPVSEPARSKVAAAPAKARTGKSAPASRTQPFSQVDSIANVPAPPKSPMSPKQAVKSPAAIQSPSVRHAVASMVRETSPAPQSAPQAAPSPAPAAATAPAPQPTLPPLTDDQRKMTLEAYIRQQYALRADEMRADGEALIQKFEAKARETRAMLEQR